MTLVTNVLKENHITDDTYYENMPVYYWQYKHNPICSEKEASEKDEAKSRKYIKSEKCNFVN